MALKQVMENDQGKDDNFKVTIAVLDGENELVKV